ncbi:hypothetical protein L0128_12310, partial [candidate division KSB1 bacterium]|nr:hypothetical protein [candidate division KSB1 bacterium]
KPFRYEYYFLNCNAATFERQKSVSGYRTYLVWIGWNPMNSLNLKIMGTSYLSSASLHIKKY